MNVDDKQVISGATEPADQPTVVYERGDRETTTEAVVAAVSSALETPATELDPIYDVVDSDALDDLFPRGDGRESDARGAGVVDGHVAFCYAGRLVRVRSDGTVCVFPTQDG